MDLYGVADGDPVNFSDPFGLCAVKGALVSVAIGKGLAAATGSKYGAGRLALDVWAAHCVSVLPYAAYRRFEQGEPHGMRVARLPGDVSQGHVHIEELNPRTGEVLRHLAPSLGESAMSGYVLKEYVAVERKQDFYMLTVPKAAEIEWCAALMLLAEGLAGLVETNDRSLSISIDQKLAANKRGSVDVSAGALRLRLTPTELRSWLHFFLRAVRDGAPDVDHLDCELRGGREPVDLIVAVQCAKKPMSSEQARKQLGQ